LPLYKVMATAKKLMRICKAFLLTAGVLFASISCGTKYDLNDNNDIINNNNNNISGTILFYNGSTYHISIHRDAFSGPLLVDKLSPGASSSVEINPNNNYGGSFVFSVVYWKEIRGEADVWTKSRDNIDEQIPQNIEAGKKYTIRVVPKSEMEFTESFLKIINASGSPFELSSTGNTYFQAGGDGRATVVESGKSGVYKIEVGNIRGRFISQITKTYPLPDFTAESGYTYTFEFNGNEVTLTEAEQI